MKTVKEVSNLTGVSVRTLHYYDSMGLLKPTAVTESGYRLYDDAALEKLQLILLFRELQFPLKEIKEIVSNPNFDKNLALKQQIKLLELQKERIGKLISFAREIQITGVDKMDFSAFDTKEIDEYIAQAKAMWGTTQQYHQFEEKTKNRSKEEQLSINAGLMDFFKKIGEMKDLSPENEKIQQTVDGLQQYITDNFYTCSNEIFASLGAMYVSSGSMTDNINKVGGAGTAELASKAIEIYCNK